ncbi:DUF4440 domain-containing protein [Roseateles sp. SL47]|uniref:DUF4440 domain-containing protein n=1 Tax=Roseateles sp. SL47 TaxID=2995138 RepID=UPI00226FD0B6|nr:DUF4440 domain-containing protein [Roseateles sp. SL47]WAC70823.1 DUF4440 domain-containing protein [Roseateles sp. SL47]
MDRDLLVTLAACVALTGCAVKSGAPVEALPQHLACAQSSDDVKQVTNLRRQLWTSLNQGHLDAVMALLDQRAVLVSPDANGAEPLANAVGTPAQIHDYFAKKILAAGYQFNLVGGQGLAVLDCKLAVVAEKTRVSRDGHTSEIVISSTLKKTDGQWRLWLLNLGKLP